MTLVILAAGMGSRYGGLKQIDPFTENGEFIIDFSIYDAIQAGFDKVVFIVKEENYEAFRETVGHRVEKKIKVEYVFQKLTSYVPDDKLPADRIKPWGTTHAILCAKEAVHENFAVINADDFYGRDAFIKAAEFLRAHDVSEKHYCMVGYLLGNTLTDNGSVARGECHKDENNMLSDIEERTKLFKEDGGAYYTDENGVNIHLGNDTVVSMNFWCFSPMVFEGFKEDFESFLNDEKTDFIKGEAFLPNTVGKLINKGDCDVEVLTTSAKWFGVTYSADKPDVIAKLASLIEDGTYPRGLWK